MEEIKKYICGVCHRQYDTKEQCEYCEKIHIREEEFKKSSFPEFAIGDIVEHTDEHGDKKIGRVTECFLMLEGANSDGTGGEWHWEYCVLFDEYSYWGTIKTEKNNLRLVLNASLAKMEYDRMRERMMLQYGLELEDFIELMASLKNKFEESENEES